MLTVGGTKLSSLRGNDLLLQYTYKQIHKMSLPSIRVQLCKCGVGIHSPVLTQVEFIIIEG